MSEDRELDDFEAEPVSDDEAKDNDEALRRDHSPGAESPHIPTTAEHMQRLTPDQLAQVGEQLGSTDISDISDASPKELDELRSAYEDELSRQVGQLLDESGTGNQAGVQSSSQQDLSEKEPLINEQQPEVAEIMPQQEGEKQDLSKKEQPVTNEQLPEVAGITPEVTVLRKEPRVAKKRNRIQKSKIAQALPLIEEGLKEKT